MARGGSRQQVANGQVSSTIDVSRMRAAVSGPGIDPRVWIVWATVLERGFDPEEGIFVDVQFQPEGTIETCYLGQPYAGSEWGAHFPVEVGDTILLAVPMGDTGMVSCIIARAHNSGDKPNAELQNGEQDTDDVVIRVKPNQRLVIRTSGAGDAVDIKIEGNGELNLETAAGNVNITVAAGAQINLGGDSLTVPIHGVVQGEGIDPFTGLTQAALGNASLVVAAKRLP